MWKKTDEGREEMERSAPPAVVSRAPQRTTGVPGPVRSNRGDTVATIGPTIKIKGEVTGSEKLRVEGSIEGGILIKDSELIVGSQGRLNANVSAQNILVEGEVQGDIQAKELVTLRSSAKVTGSVTAPRIVVEDGCKFKGKIDMEQHGGSASASSGGGASSSSSGGSSSAAESRSRTASSSSASTEGKAATNS